MFPAVTDLWVLSLFLFDPASLQSGKAFATGSSSRTKQQRSMSVVINPQIDVLQSGGGGGGSGNGRNNNNSGGSSGSSGSSSNRAPFIRSQSLQTQNMIKDRPTIPTGNMLTGNRCSLINHT